MFSGGYKPATTKTLLMLSETKQAYDEVGLWLGEKRNCRKYED